MCIKFNKNMISRGFRLFGEIAYIPVFSERRNYTFFRNIGGLISFIFYCGLLADVPTGERLRKI